MNSTTTDPGHRQWNTATAYIDAAVSTDSRRTRLRAVLDFEQHFGDLHTWYAQPVATRR